MSENQDFEVITISDDEYDAAIANKELEVIIISDDDEDDDIQIEAVIRRIQENESEEQLSTAEPEIQTVEDNILPQAPSEYLSNSRQENIILEQRPSSPEQDLDIAGVANDVPEASALQHEQELLHSTGRVEENTAQITEDIQNCRNPSSDTQGEIFQCTVELPQIRDVPSPEKTTFSHPLDIPLVSVAEISSPQANENSITYSNQEFGYTSNSYESCATVTENATAQSGNLHCDNILQHPENEIFAQKADISAPLNVPTTEDEMQVDDVFFEADSTTAFIIPGLETECYDKTDINSNDNNIQSCDASNLCNDRTIEIANASIKDTNLHQCNFLQPLENETASITNLPLQFEMDTGEKERIDSCSYISSSNISKQRELDELAVNGVLHSEVNVLPPESSKPKIHSPTNKIDFGETQDKNSKLNNTSNYEAKIRYKYRGAFLTHSLQVKRPKRQKNSENFQDIADCTLEKLHADIDIPVTITGTTPNTFIPASFSTAQTERLSQDSNLKKYMNVNTSPYREFANIPLNPASFPSANCMQSQSAAYDYHLPCNKSICRNGLNDNAPYPSPYMVINSGTAFPALAQARFASLPTEDPPPPPSPPPTLPFLDLALSPPLVNLTSNENLQMSRAAFLPLPSSIVVRQHTYTTSTTSSCLNAYSIDWTLLPQSLMSRIGIKMMSPTEVFVIILSWNTEWLAAPNNSNIPPFIRDRIHHVCRSYRSHEDYFNTYFPLLLCEIWERIYLRWKAVEQQQTPGYSSNIDSWQEEEYLLRTKCSVYATSNERYPLEGNVILLEFENEEESIFGYVSGHGHTRSASERSFLNEVKHEFYIIIIKKRTAFKGKVTIHFLYNIISSLNQVKAIRDIRLSPFIDVILSPPGEKCNRIVIERFRTTSNVCINRAVEQIMSSVLFYDPNPRLTLVDVSFGVDQLMLLIAVIEWVTNVKTDGSRSKVLVCVRSNHRLNEIACRLLPTSAESSDDAIKTVILAKRTAVRDELKEMTLESITCQHLEYKEKFERGENLEADVEYKTAQNQLLDASDVLLSFITTCHDSNMEEVVRRQRKCPFSICIIDEAYMTTEPESLIPFLYGINKIILFGDRKARPKTWTNIAKSNGFQVSLASRIFKATKD